MVASTFDEFVKQRTTRARQCAEALNSGETLDAWLRELDALYSAMQEYLKSYIDSGEITIERRPVQLTEDYLGTYDADALFLCIGDDEVIAKPVGTLLIGSRGRVDLSGPRKTLRMVLLDNDSPAIKIDISGTGGPIEATARSLWRGAVDRTGWYFVTQPPAATATALDEDSFRDAIMDVSSA